MRQRRVVFIVSALLSLSFVLSGCSINRRDPIPPAPTLPALPSASGPLIGSPSAAPVLFTGTGSQTVTVNRPQGARYLQAVWKCSGGTGKVTLQEDPAVFEGGNCGGDSGYTMPLPSSPTVLHFEITVVPATSWSFGGSFR